MEKYIAGDALLYSVNEARKFKALNTLIPYHATVLYWYILVY